MGTQAILLAATLLLSATTTSAATATTSYLSLLDSDGIPTNETKFTNQGANIVRVDQQRNETTAVLNCLSSDLGHCALTSPATIIVGPSTAAITFSTTSESTYAIATDSSMIIYYVTTESVNCNITSSTQSAFCITTQNAWASYQSITDTMNTTRSTDLSAITYQAIPITAGLDKLVVSATTTVASTSTSTSTSTTTASTTGTTASTSSTSGSSSRFKAWIAGPVIGALAGCALIAAAVYWWMRRRNRPAEGIADIPTDRTPYKAELPADNVATATWQPDEVVRAELPSPDVDEFSLRNPQRLSELA